MIERIKRTPSIDPKKVNGISILRSLKSVLPDLKYLKELVIEEKLADNLFVPNAKCGGKPAIRNAGILIIPPPPAMLSTQAATKPKKHSKKKESVLIVTFTSVISESLFVYYNEVI